MQFGNPMLVTLVRMHKRIAPSRICAMFGLRAILLWLMMLAVPFQGYAAAAMAFCDTQPTHALDQAAAAPHDHAKHAHASAKQGDAHHVESGHGGSHDLATGDGWGDVPDVSHECGNCAPCHSVALVPTTFVVAVHGLPQADLAEPRQALASVSPSVPHKPPRA